MSLRDIPQSQNCSGEQQLRIVRRIHWVPYRISCQPALQLERRTLILLQPINKGCIGKHRHACRVLCLKNGQLRKDGRKMSLGYRQLDVRPV